MQDLDWTDEPFDTIDQIHNCGCVNAESNKRLLQAFIGS